MPRKNPDSLLDLPPLELQCMKALWSLGEATVEDIRAALMPRRPLAYTTILTVMDRLARKGMVERRKRGRAHLYSSAVQEESVREHAVGRLLDNFFAGSRDQLRSHLALPPREQPAPPRPKPAAPATKPKTRAVARAERRRTAPPSSGIDPALL
jgi:BlaI family transcriptional regulator, penicillinase repressor